MFYKKINPTRTTRRQSRAALGLLSSSLLGSILLFASLFSSGLAAAACTNTPDPSQGTDTQTINVTTAGTYTIWSRILAPDTTNNSYYLQIDGGCAINVGDSSSIPANNWTWVNYQNGTSSSVITANLTAGNHQIVMTGREAGVGVEQVLFLTDASCNPATTNCTPPVNTPPVVSITAPASGATVSGTSVPLSANATDDAPGVSVAFAIDGNTVGTDTSSPYSVNWDSTKVSSGSHTLKVTATDAGGLTTTAQENITVSNTTKAPPTVSLSAPANNATVSGTTNITANTSSGVTSVQFKLDGANLGSADTSSPYSYSWDTTKVANGTHTLTAVASDGTSSATATTVTVTVNNKTSTPLTVSLTAPANNATVSGSATPIVATASSTATSVQFKLDGANLGSADTSSPYSYSWDTTKVANGTHTLSAVASDGTGTATATNVTVTVNNQSTTPPLTISVSAPANNATVSGTAPVSASASSNTTSVQFQLDGKNLGSADTSAPYTYSWDTKTVNNGTHTLTAIASDAANNTKTSSAVTVTVNNPVVQTPGAVQNLAFNAANKTLTWSAYPGASSYVVAQVHNPTTTRNTDYTWPHVTTTSCVPGSSTCALPLPASGETVNYGIIPLDANGQAICIQVSSTGTCTVYVGWAKEITVTWPTTTPPADTTPPTQPTGLTASAVSSSQINLAWTASTDNVGVTGYRIYRSDSTSPSPTLVNTVNTTTYGDTGRSPNTKYTYYVVAIDAAKNASPNSASASATTTIVSTALTIQGTIRNAYTRLPIKGVHVYSDAGASANGVVSSYTDASGKYNLTNITPYPAKHNYFIVATGYRSQSYYGIALSGGTNGINIENLNLTPQ